MQKYIKLADIYGYKVNLKYDGYNTHKTLFGGIVSIFTILALSAAIIVSLNNLQ